MRHVGQIRVQCNRPGTEVILDGVSLGVHPIQDEVFIEPGNHLVEARLEGYPLVRVNVVVTHNGLTSNTATASAVATAPGLFTYSLGGKTYPSALYNGTYTIVGDPALYGSALKAKAGDIIQLYATGLGTSPAGNIIQSAIAFSSPVGRPSMLTWFFCAQ